MRPAVRILALLAAALLLPWAAPTGEADRPLLGPSAPSLPTAHVMVVVMENLAYDEAIRVPELAALMRRYAYAAESYALAHPSLPNYLGLTGGSTFGVDSDCWFCYVRAPNLASELAAHHVSFGLYMEGLPRRGWLGPYWPFTGYAGKHDPFRYYVGVRSTPALRDHLEPLSALLKALSGPAAKVPRFVWVTPNLCHDGHDCPPATAARWLAGFVAKVTASPAWKAKPGSVLFVTWDEGSGGDDRGVGPSGRVVAGDGGGHILTLVVAPDLPHGYHVATPLNHYGLLKFVEEAFHLPLLGATSRPGVSSYAVFWRHTPRKGDPE